VKPEEQGRAALGVNKQPPPGAKARAGSVSTGV